MDPFRVQRQQLYGPEAFQVESYHHGLPHSLQLLFFSLPTEKNLDLKPIYRKNQYP